MRTAPRAWGVKRQWQWQIYFQSVTRVRRLLRRCAPRRKSAGPFAKRRARWPVARACRWRRLPRVRRAGFVRSRRGAIFPQRVARKSGSRRLVRGLRRKNVWLVWLRSRAQGILAERQRFLLEIGHRVRSSKVGRWRDALHWVLRGAREEASCELRASK